jgi:hypothetical protein
MLPRLIELLFFLFILYLLFRRIGAPFLRGYDARERERQTERMRRTPSPTEQTKPQQRIDRSQVEDAEFKDID